MGSIDEIGKRRVRILRFISISFVEKAKLILEGARRMRAEVEKIPELILAHKEDVI
jgi:hypothetical protein